MDIHGVTLNAFRKMSNLRLVYLLGDEYSLSDETNYLCFKKLKHMFWYKFPLKSLDNTDMGNVVVLDLKFSKLETLWVGFKSLKKLRVLDVSYSYSLTETGNFYGLENLEELKFDSCENLKELHSSISCLQKLTILNLKSSILLKRAHWENIGSLTSLQKLILGNNFIMDLQPDEAKVSLLHSLKKCPITELELYGCNISKIFGGVVSLAWLKHLFLYKTNTPTNPDSFLQLHNLDTFELNKCDSIQSIPKLPGNITSIKARDCASLMNLPCNTSELKFLTVLDFGFCPKLGTEVHHLIMMVTGLTNLTHLRMDHCGVSDVPSEIGNLVSLKELHLSSNTFSSLPDSLSNLSQLVDLNLMNCQQLRLLPLLPSNLTNIHARSCRSLDAMSSASLRTKVCKESSFSNRFVIRLPWKEEVPKWCGYQSRVNVLSFVAPENNICGIILCTNNSKNSSGITVPKMYNKTKNTSHRFKTKYTSQPITTNFSVNRMLVMCYPLDDTTLVVEPGDSVVLKLPQGSVSTCGLRLIYENDVVDCKLVIQTGNEPPSHIPSETSDDYSRPLDEDYSCSDEEEYPCSDDGDYSSSIDDDYPCSADEDYSCFDDADNDA